LILVFIIIRKYTTMTTAAMCTFESIPARARRIEPNPFEDAFRAALEAQRIRDAVQRVRAAMSAPLTRRDTGSHY
jgi:hypothetical protein